MVLLILVFCAISITIMMLLHGRQHVDAAKLLGAIILASLFSPFLVSYLVLSMLGWQFDTLYTGAIFSASVLPLVSSVLIGLYRFAQTQG